WQRAARLIGFSQYRPVDGRPAEDSTEVLVWYAPDAIWFGVRAYEPHGNVVRATLTSTAGPAKIRPKCTCGTHPTPSGSACAPTSHTATWCVPRSPTATTSTRTITSRSCSTPTTITAGRCCSP